MDMDTEKINSKGLSKMQKQEMAELMVQCGIITTMDGPLAQLAEHLTFNQGFCSPHKSPNPKVSFTSRQNLIDEPFSRVVSLISAYHAGGGNHVDTKIIHSHLNKIGGGNHENNGGCC